ncbi:MAG: AAA family ATPase [Gemmatimonadota bacterium]|nr:AAA family ATPase [Gemmatimonadota bacterium]
MLTHLIVRNFKRFESVEIELGSPVVFIGPNNSGKTSAMQALALWDIGLRRWNEKWGGHKTPGKRPGVAVNRRDLVSIPVPHANLLWRGLRVRNVDRAAGKTVRTSNIRIDVTVGGIREDGAWECGLEFDYANEESFYCRPLRLTEDQNPERMPVPAAAGELRIAFLPPMSGLAATETRLDQGAVNVRVGEGRTAEVLRNLCYTVHQDGIRWVDLVRQIEALFGARLQPPRYIPERGEIAMSYEEQGIDLDLSSAGRGLQQTLLLLAYMYAHPGAVLLLDEPDAHLEILRQRQIYQLLTETAEETGSQIIAASHSEVLLNEAAGRDMVIAFVGKPHRLDNRGSQVLKSLREIGFEHYYQAEQTGWVLFLEGSTDLSLLRAFAARLDHHPALRALERPYVRYVSNQPTAAANHFHALREALPDLRGVALFDRLDRELPDDGSVEWLMWERREFENYVATRRTLERYAAASGRDATPGPLFAESEQSKRVAAMSRSIASIEEALKKLGKGSPWDPDVKASDDFLTPLFADYFERLGLPNVMPKKSFHVLARHVPRDEIDAEIGEKLDAIARVAGEAEGRG